MLHIKRPARRARRSDWYPDKVYLHFDGPLSRAKATKLVTNPAAVISHSFLPLIGFDKRERRYRRQKNALPSIKAKISAIPSLRIGNFRNERSCH